MNFRQLSLKYHINSWETFKSPSCLCDCRQHVKTCCLQSQCTSIGDVANSKCNQWLDEILNLLPAHPRNQHSCLLENSVRHILYETHGHIYNKRMLITQDRVKFRGGRARAYCMTEISRKQLCWFPRCAGKNNIDSVPSLVAFGINNICYWNLMI